MPVPVSLFLAFGEQILWPVAIPFAINLIASTALSLTKFGLWNLPLPVPDLALVLIVMLWAMTAVWQHCRRVAVVQIPYVSWVPIANGLQFTINWNN
ncbi:MAG: tryptophan-rich sensory protein [Rubripirellula sp.]